MPAITDTYKGLPVLTLRPNFRTLKRGQLSDFSYKGRSYGMATPFKETSLVRRQVDLPFVLENGEMVKRFRNFLHDRFGRVKLFWLPMYMGDLWLSGNMTAGASTFNIANNDYESRWDIGNQCRNLCALTPTEMQYFSVGSVLDNGATEQITLATGQTLDMNMQEDNTVICELLLCRFYQDKFRFKLRHDEHWETKTRFVECPSYVPDPDEMSPTWDEGFAMAYGLVFDNGISQVRCSDWGTTHTTDGETWYPADMKISSTDNSFDQIAIKQSIDLGDSSQELEAVKNALLLYATSQWTVSIYELNPILDTSQLLFTGLVTQARPRDKGLVTLVLNTQVMQSGQELGIRQFQRTCNWTLGEPNTCKVNVAALTITPTITAGNFSMISDPPYIMHADIATASGADPNYFAFGKALAGNAYRWIIGQDAVDPSKLYLAAPFAEDDFDWTTGGQVSIEPGCDGRMFTCVTKYNNLQNAFAMPGLPNNNPQFDALEIPDEGGGKK